MQTKHNIPPYQNVFWPLVGLFRIYVNSYTNALFSNFNKVARDDTVTTSFVNTKLKYMYYFVITAQMSTGICMKAVQAKLEKHLAAVNIMQ